VDAVKEAAMVGIGDAFASEFRSGRHRDLAGILVAVDVRVRALGQAETLEARSRFRIVGDPVVPLGTALRGPRR
jgi:hypothetical protein